MKEQVVADSTCLIGLERIGRLELLPALFDFALVPPEVQREFGRILVWLKVQAVANLPLVESLKLLVDAGEAEAVALARESGLRLVVDDRKARAVARRLGIRIIGTVGVLVHARKVGLLNLLQPALDELETEGFFIGEDLRSEALRLVGE